MTTLLPHRLTPTYPTVIVAEVVLQATWLQSDTEPSLHSVIFVATLSLGARGKTIDIVLASYCRLFDSVPISAKAISSTNRTNRIAIGKELNLHLPILKCSINVDQSICRIDRFILRLLYQILIRSAGYCCPHRTLSRATPNDTFHDTPHDFAV